ncbi:MAG: hypothetical protein FWF88_06260 [Peptococcaceae bacterium]|nr:hypothetical protein [Peptococcaceae bacterium]
MLVICHNVISKILILCVLVMLVNWPIQIVVRRPGSSRRLKSLGTWLEKQHKWLGFITILVTIAHCCVAEIMRALGYGGENPVRIAHGLMLLLVLMPVVWLLGKPLTEKWLAVHKLLAVLILLLGAGHVLFEAYGVFGSF